MASACGARIVEMIWEDLKPSQIIDARSFRNGLVAYMALYWGVFGVLYSFTKGLPWVARVFLVPAFWVGLELRDSNRENMEKWFKVVHTLSHTPPASA